MAVNFSNLRKSVGIKILFSSVLSNLVVFGQPMQEMVLDHYSKKNKSAISGYVSDINENTFEANKDTKPHDSHFNSYSKLHHFGSEHKTVFYASQAKGTIGKSFQSEVDNPYDNFFTVVLPDNVDPDQYEAIMAYEVSGVAAASQTTKSINNYPSYGGKAIIARTSQWIAVSETIPASQIKAGSNEIYFNRRVEENYQYSIRNLRIELKEKSAVSMALTEKELYNFKGSVFVSGTAVKEIVSVQAMGVTIPVSNGVFEYIFTAIPEDTKKIEFAYADSYGRTSSVEVPLSYKDEEFGFRFSDALPDNTATTYLLGGDSAGGADHNGICINLSDKTIHSGIMSVQGLRFKDVRTLNDDVENVTGGDYLAYRIKKLHLPDNASIELHLKYNPEQIPEGYTARDIKTFYYDNSTRGWKALPVDAIDYENYEIISTAVAGETDYINGIIKVPDSPETGSFAPTTISDMKLADPAAGVVSIAPPSPNSSGTATTGFPLKLPAGRNGMQPSLEVSYNSEGGNGWMGIGWNLNMPAITLNTKWGVPTYTSGIESEIYSLNGADLVLKLEDQTYTNPHRRANITRTAERIFYLRKEGGYQKIIRHGSTTKNYWWEVIDKQGNKTFYGGVTALDPNAIITDPDGNIAHWAITKTQDTYGNYVEYIYTPQFSSPVASGSAITAKEFYPEKIRYTKHASSTSNYYEVEFKRNTYLLGSGGSATRNDAIVSARNGFLQLTDELLTEVYVSFVQGGTPQRIRSYRFDYGDMQFKKKQLEKISEFDSANQLFYSNTLEYYSDYTGGSIIPASGTSWSGDDDNIRTPFDDLEGATAGISPNGSPLGTSASSGMSFGFRAGIGLDLNITNVSNSVGGSFNYSKGSSNPQIALIDLNGDGLPDKLFKDNMGIYYRQNTGSGFGQAVSVTGGIDMGKTKSSTTGAGVDLNVGFNDKVSAGIGKSWSKTRSETDGYFTDFNGDGLPDLVNDGRVWFNNSSGGGTIMRIFQSSVTNTENSIESGPVDASIIPDLKLPTMDELRDAHPQFDHVKVWTAPYTGEIDIESTATLTPFSLESGQPNTFKLTLERSWSTQTLNTQQLSLASQSATFNYSGLEVTKGDKLFFRIHNQEDGYGGEIEWNPKITYSSATDILLSSAVDDSGKQLNYYDAEQDFIVNNDGAQMIQSGSITIYYNLPSFATSPSDDINFVIEKIRTKLEDGTTEVLNTWKRTYNHISGSYVTGSSSFPDYVNAPEGYKDEFRFSVQSNSNVDWGAIKWKPYYTDSNSEDHYPGIDYVTYDDNMYQQGYWIESSSLVAPVIANSYDEQTDFMQLSHNLFDYEPQLDALADNQFPLEINWVTKSEIAGEVKVIQTRKYYIYRDSSNNYKYTRTNNPFNALIPVNDVAAGYDDIVDINKKTIKDIIDTGGKIYSAFYIKDERLAHEPVVVRLNLYPGISGYSFSEVVLKKPFWLSRYSFFGLTYRGWSQFIYNGGLKFDHDDEGNITNLGDNFGNLPLDLGLFDEQTQGGNAQGIDMNADPEDMSIGNNVIRYSFYDSRNEDNTYINKAIVTGEYGFNSNGNLKVKVGRFGERNIHEIYIDPASLLTSSPGVFVGMKQRSESKGSAVSGDVGLDIAGANGTESKATSEVLNQYIDLNGDRYPDIVTKGKIQFTNMLGALSSSISNTGQFVPGDENSDFTSGISIASEKPNSSTITPTNASQPIAFPSSNSSTSAPPAPKTTPSNGTAGVISGGINGGFGKSKNSRLWADMNGDGLPDKVRVNDSSIEVWLNTGYDFSESVFWGTGYNNLVASERTNVGGGFNFSKSFAFGFGASTNTANVNAMIIDVNGDGLPDLLLKSAGAYIYYLNTGNKFSTQSAIFYGSDKVEEDKTLAGNVFGAYTYGTPVILFLINFKLIFTGSVGFNASISEKTSSIQDINGDGLPDVISKGSSSNNSVISAKLNTIGRTYLLKKVNTPLGGSWSIDYKREGNTYDMPESKWVVKEIRTHDGFTADNTYGPDVTLTEATYEDPKYDRREREFYGFGKVTIKQINPSDNTVYRKQVKLYHTENYYLSGAEKQAIAYDQNGQKLTETNTLFNLLSPDSPAVNMNANAENNYLQTDLIGIGDALLDRSRLFIAVAKVSSTSYENGQGLTAVKEFSKYDGNGNLLSYLDKGEGATDAYRSVIEYYDEGSFSFANGNGFPRNIGVYKNMGGQPLRYRTAAYNSLGKLSQITTKLNNAENNTISFGYDAFGNLTTVNDLDNLNASSSHFVKTIAYDTVLNTYPVTVSNSFGEASQMTYNYLFGVPVLTEDTNHQLMRMRVDNKGRITEVTGPNEMALESNYGADTAWTIRNEYEASFIAAPVGSSQSTTSQHHAVTKHFDPEYASGSVSTTNELKTVSIVDGLGQGIQIKKTHPAGTGEWLVSGFAEKDAFGRVLKSYLPATQATSDYNYYAPSSQPDLYPTEMTYDAKDRVLTVKQPDETTAATISYSIEGNMFAQKTTNELSQTMDVYTDIRGRQRKTVQNGEITTKFNYNVIGELIEVVDNDGLKTATLYDMAGRKTEMRHPDRGVIKFKYDKASRMIEQSTSNLLLATGGAQKIKYHYDFSRLTMVEYPQNPTNNVEYTYGAATGDTYAAANNAVGRLVQQKDASGVQIFGYGRMGEVTKNLRSVAVAGFQSYWFLTSWKYDSWNRVQEITYPDQEIVSYGYNAGGELNAINSEIYGLSNLQPIVSSIVYNQYGERVSLERGNGTTTTYTYDNRRRMNNVTNNFNSFTVSNNYGYDILSNITSIITQNPENTLPSSGQLGGPIVHLYEYDEYNRLEHAAGAYTGPNDETVPYLKKEYDLVMQYNTDHTIKKKTQVLFQGTAASAGSAIQDQVTVYKSSYSLEYMNYKKGAFVVGNYGYLQPHAPRTIFERPTGVGAISEDDPRIRQKEISYDANGNQTEIKEVVGTLKTSLRKNLWDEENRLMAVNLKPDESTDHPIAIYTYDAGGQRIVRYNMDRMDVSSNAQEVAQSTKENVMLYPSGLLMGKALHTGNKGDNPMTYTKHYYIGSERISAKTGTSRMGFYPKTVLSGVMPDIDESAIKSVASDVLTNETNKVTAVYAKFSQDPPVFTPNEEDGTTGYSHSEPTLELNTYYFHPDHLGSSAYISNAAGVVTQHMEYLPFGETLTDEHSNSFNSPFKYNGKEFDEETGNYYYSARYYDPKWSIFISVDPLAEKHPDYSSYVYCANNPIILVDPDGKDWVFITNKEGKRTPIYDKNIHSQKAATTKYGKEALHVGNGFRYTSVDGRIELQAGGKSEKLTNVHVLIVASKTRGFNDVGHTAIQVGEGVYGYYPGDENNNGYEKSELMGSKGEMHLESRAAFDVSYLEDGFTDFTLEITESQALKLEKNLQNKIANPGTYSLYGDQCTSVAAKALLNAGVDIQGGYNNDHFSPGFEPIVPRLLSPSAFKRILSDYINTKIVVKQKTYGGN